MTRCSRRLDGVLVLIFVVEGRVEVDRKRYAWGNVMKLFTEGEGDVAGV
jgi:hypothetical protein